MLKFYYQLHYLLIVSLLPLASIAQNVGIGTTSPRVKLEVLNGHVLIDGTPAAAYPSLGTGTRLQWDQQLGAFRIGSVTGTQWDAGFVGANSFAGGLDAQARGAQSFAWGTNAIAIGERTVAIGDNQLALNVGSVIIGRQIQSISDSAMVFNTGGPSLYSSAFETRTMAFVTGSTHPSVYIQASLTAGEPGNVGVGSRIADEQLTVTGNARVSDTLKTNRLQVQQGPVNPGDVLMASDTHGNAEWQTPPAIADTDWSRTGNAGTSARTFPNTGGPNFIGTTDAQPLSFATNDTAWMQLTERGELTLRSRTNPIGMPPRDGIVIRDDHSALSPTATYTSSVIIGQSAALNSEIGSNVAIGFRSLRNSVVGGGHTALGGNSLLNLTNGERNTSLGAASSAFLLNGSYNLLAGYNSGAFLSEGDRNVCLGAFAGVASLTAAILGDENTLIGYDARAMPGLNRVIVIGAGLRASHSGAFVTGDANGVFTSSAANSFNARFAGGYELFTDATATIGVRVPAGGNSWASISDSTLKSNYLPADPELLLSRLDDLRLGTWNYTSQPRTRRHYGPMAQEFFAAYGRDFYGSIGNSTTLQSADVDGVLFILIKGLKDRNEALEERVEHLESTVETLMESIQKLENAQR